MTEERLRTRYKYRCPICGWSCTKEQIPGVSVPVTPTGDYGDKGGPTGTEFTDEIYEAATIAFTAASGDDPAYLTDSTNRFGEKLFKSEMPIRIETTSGTNDGDYTIAARGVSRGTILLSSSDSLTTETASTAGTVTISKICYKPDDSQGCPGCGSRNTRTR